MHGQKNIKKRKDMCLPRGTELIFK